MNARHSCKTAEHYTPEPFAVAAQYVLGDIDLDPASSPTANRVIQARRIYTAAYDGLSLPWGGRVFVNPPGDRRGFLVRAYWRRACEHALYGGPGAAVLWLGFSLEQLQTLQRCGTLFGEECPSPLAFPHIICRRRIQFMDVTGRPGKSPTHGNYFCLLGGDRWQRALFREAFGRFGAFGAGTQRVASAVARELGGEILTALRAHGPLTRRAVARVVRARTARVLVACRALVASGALVVRDRKLMFPGRETQSSNPARVALAGQEGQMTITFHKANA